LKRNEKKKEIGFNLCYYLFVSWWKMMHSPTFFGFDFFSFAGAPMDFYLYHYYIIVYIYIYQKLRFRFYIEYRLNLITIIRA